MASQAHDEPITGSSLTASPRILNKKKKKTKNEKSNTSRRWRLQKSHHIASSLAEIKPHYPIQKQTKHKTQQTKHTDTEDRAQRCLSKKKKKIPNTQTKTKPSNPRTVTSPSSSPQRARRLRRRNGRPSSQIDIDIVDRPSVIGIRLIALPFAPLPLHR